MKDLAAIVLVILGAAGCATGGRTPAGAPARPAGTAGGSVDAHVSKSGPPGHVVDDAVMLERLDEAVRDVPPNAAAARVALGDIGYPESADEARKMGGMAMLLVTALSHEANELPLARVVLRAGDKEWPLPRLGYRVTTLTNADSPAGRTFGVHRYDGIYYLPIAATRHEGGLYIDFAANRTDFRSLQFTEGASPLPEGVAEAPIGQPDPDTVALFTIREFPLVAQGQWTMAK